MRRLTLISAVGLVCLVSASAASAQGWTLEPTPPLSAPSSLTSVSCVNRHMCLAVGVQQAFLSPGAAAIVERWNGARWKSAPIPAFPSSSPSNDALLGVSCPATRFCVAVGYDVNGPAAARWNGHRWKLQRLPSLAGQSVARLGLVSCPTVRYCVAIGSAGANGRPLSEVWSAARWEVVPWPSPAGQSNVSGLSCPSRLVCVAVGTINHFSSNESSEPFAVRWNGTRWMAQSLAPVPGGGFGGVSCPVADQCEAVGTDGTPAGFLAEHWNGTGWTLQSTPTLSSLSITVNGVSCPTTSLCTAVGTQFLGPTDTPGLAFRWNGTTWVQQQTPSALGSQQPFVQLLDVSCPGTRFCMAVGAGGGAGAGTETPLAERYLATPPH